MKYISRDIKKQILSFLGSILELGMNEKNEENVLNCKKKKKKKKLKIINQNEALEVS